MSRKRFDTHERISRRILVCTKPTLTMHCSICYEIPTFLSVGVFVCVLCVCVPCTSAVFAQNSINLKCLNQLRFLGKHQHKHTHTNTHKHQHKHTHKHTKHQHKHTHRHTADKHLSYCCRSENSYMFQLVYHYVHPEEGLMWVETCGCDWACSCKQLRLTATCCCYYKDDLCVVYGCTYFHPCSMKQLRGP